MICPPVLETNRLVLRAHTTDTLEPMAAMWADPAVVRYIAGRPSTPRESWMRMLSYLGCWSVRGYGYWAIWSRESGRYIGDLGFADFHREIEPSIVGIPEAGWALASWAHGQGFATEALFAALSWLDEQPGHGRSVCLIAPDNLASVRIAEKVGFHEPAPKSLGDRPVLLFSRPRGRGANRSA